MVSYAISLVLRECDTDSENVSLKWLYVSDGRKHKFIGCLIDSYIIKQPTILFSFYLQVVKLTWYPMTRDSLFYLISVAALVIAINDEKVHW